MSTEVTPESLRAHATWLNDRGAKESYMALTRWSDDLECEQRPLPTVPGWYPSIVVERGGESCTGALRSAGGSWATANRVDEHLWHFGDDAGVTIRWAEQDGTTPGQTVYETWTKLYGFFPWSGISPATRDRYERAAAAVLAAHGTPTLTPVGEHPVPGTRGLLPVTRSSGGWYSKDRDTGYYICNIKVGRQIILTDPRPDGAHE